MNRLFKNPFLNYVKILDIKAYNVHAGTFTAGDWRTRDFNTIDSDESKICSISSNQITLESGIYICSIQCPCYQSAHAIARLYNITDSVEVSLGGTFYLNGTTAAYCFIKDKFILTSQKTFEVQHRCDSTRANDGLGIAHQISGINNIYSIAEFWRKGL